MADGRATSLNPTLLTRIREGMQPDWVHTVRARRIAAAGLVVLAGAAALRANPHGEHSVVYVASRDLPPGVALTSDDVRTEALFTATLPDGAQAEAATVLGATLAGPVRRGEVLTDVRLLGSRLAQSVAGPDARIVPMHLADDAVLDLVRVGDVVDVLAAPAAADHGDPRLVATNAVVVLVSAASNTPQERVVLVALPAPAATAVAGASLTDSLTITLH